MAQDAGGPVSMTPGLHDLRHFYAAGLIVAGCDVVTVQRALGHQSAVVTLSTYGLFVADSGGSDALAPLLL